MPSKAAALANIYHNLSVMQESGVLLVRSLRSVSDGAPRQLARALAEQAEIVAGGGRLSEAMAERPNLFDPLDVLLVEVGETSGNLAGLLAELSRRHFFRNRLRRLGISMLLLPAMNFHAAVMLVPLLLVLTAQITVADAVRMVAAALAVVYVPAAAGFAVVRWAPRTGQMRRTLDAVALRIPLLGRALMQLALSRYCHAFHAMLTAGTPAWRCAEMAIRAVGNTAVAARLAGGRESLRAGRPISEGFSSALPAEFLGAWRAGEQAGSLDDVTQRLAETAQEAAERKLRRLTVLAARLVYVLVCLWMGWMILTNAFSQRR